MKSAFLLIALALAACAQTGVDLSIPQSPALSALGIAPIVELPATPREFVFSFLNQVDAAGNPQAAVAMDLVPYWLAFGKSVDLKTYKANPIVRLLAGAQVSLAEQSSRRTVAGQVRIFDFGDPRLDPVLADCLEKAAERALAQSAPLPPGGDADQENARREALVKNTCRDEAAKRNWNRSAWSVGGAKSTAWSSAGYGFEGVPGLESTTQLIAQFIRRSGQNSAGVRLRAGAPETNLSLQFTVAMGASQLSIVFEKKVAANLWLEMTAAGANTSHVLIQTSFHWGPANN